MHVTEAIEGRRAYRALEPAEIPDETVDELARAAQITASCYNKQPWRFVFVRSPGMLEKMRATLNKGNEWAHKASMIAAVFAKKDDDCVVKEREYYLFDTGMAVSSMVLRATELELVAHPIAGYDPAAVSKTLGIPEGYMVITLVIFGRRSLDLSGLNENQAAGEPDRPPRRGLREIYSVDSYDPSLGE